MGMAPSRSQEMRRWQPGVTARILSWLLCSLLTPLCFYLVLAASQRRRMANNHKDDYDDNTGPITTAERKKKKSD